METLFIFLVKSSGLIGMFYLSYFVLLRKETFFNSNRWFLLAGLISSVIMPLIVFTKIIWVDPAPTTFDWSEIPITTATNAVENDTFEINWYLVFAIAYSIGIVGFLIKFAFDFYSLFKVLKGKTIQNHADYKFIDLKENIAPFSYFNFIVYNSSLYSETELENILEHEKIHSAQNHTADVLISRLFCVVFWFNPLMWLYKKAIVQNLEFIADSEASKNIADKKAYQLTLLKITTQENCVSITNHFYQSLIKKRIVMLNKNQSKKRNSWKYAVVLPLLGAFAFFFQTEVVAKEKITAKQRNELKLQTSDLDTVKTDNKKEDKSNTEIETKKEGEIIPNKINDIVFIDGEKISQSELRNNFVFKNIKDIKVIKGKKNDSYYITTWKTSHLKNNIKSEDHEEVTKNENKVAAIDKVEFIITKSTTDEEIKEKCEQIKDVYNIDLTFYNIKRNSSGEIINIESKNDVFPKTYTQSKNPIEPFKFFYEKKTNGGFTTGYALLSNSISRIIDNKSIDYTKAVILIDGNQSDYKALEKVNPKEVKRVITKDINSRWPENKKYAELYGEKALYGILIEIETNDYYDKNN